MPEDFRRYLHCELNTKLQRIEIAELFEKSQCGWTTCLRSTLYCARYDIESANARLHLYGENPVFDPGPVPAFLSGHISSPEEVVPMLDAVLFPAGIQYTYESNEKEDALVHAIYRRDLTEIVRILDAGADPNRKGGGDSSAIHAAGTHDDTGEIARILVSAGANINLQDENGVTPLHAAVDIAIDAAAQAQIDVIDWQAVSVFLDLGADPAIPDHDGKTVYDWMSETHHNAKEDLEEFLENRS